MFGRDTILYVRYLNEFPFLSKWYVERVMVWTSGRNLPGQNFIEHHRFPQPLPPPPPALPGWRKVHQLVHTKKILCWDNFISVVRYTHKTGVFHQFNCYRINMLHLFVNSNNQWLPVSSSVKLAIFVATVSTRYDPWRTSCPAWQPLISNQIQWYSNIFFYILLYSFIFVTLPVIL